MYKFSYTVGDYSNDGHGKTDTFALSSSHDKDDLLDAFNRGVEIIGFDIRDYAEDYEDSTIEVNAAKAFIELGVEIDGDDEEFYLDPHTIFDAIIATIKVGNPEIKIEKVEGGVDLVYTLGSTGYGCYW